VLRKRRRGENEGQGGRDVADSCLTGENGDGEGGGELIGEEDTSVLLNNTSRNKKKKIGERMKRDEKKKERSGKEKSKLKAQGEENKEGRSTEKTLTGRMRKT